MTPLLPAASLTTALLLAAEPTALVGAEPTSVPQGGQATGAPRVDSAATLRAAYQKELAYLVEEKRALLRQKEATTTSAEDNETEAYAKLGELHRRVLSLRNQADRLGRSLEQLELESDRAVEQEELVGETLRRARSALALPDHSAAGGSRPEALRTAFEAAARRLRRAGTVWREPGSFFDHDGTKTNGTIVHVGEVAAYGVSPGTAGALAPAGEGRLRMTQGDSARSARAAQHGDSTSSLTLFVFDSDEAVENKAHKTAVEIIASGGIIGWVIVVLGAIALLMVMLRALILGRAGATTKRCAEEVLAAVKADELQRAVTLCEERGGPSGRVLRATVRGLSRKREALDDMISEAVLHESPRLERFGAAIMVAAAVAPLLGLLGTVSGMISTFDIITEFGTGDPRMLSGGISEALVTTKLGLLVAIPTLLLGTILNGRAESIHTDLEHAALRVINAVEPVAPTTPAPISSSAMALRATGGAESLREAV